MITNLSLLARGEKTPDAMALDSNLGAEVFSHYHFGFDLTSFVPITPGSS